MQEDGWGWFQLLNKLGELSEACIYICYIFAKCFCLVQVGQCDNRSPCTFLRFVIVDCFLSFHHLNELICFKCVGTQPPTRYKNPHLATSTSTCTIHFTFHPWEVFSFFPTFSPVFPTKAFCFLVGLDDVRPDARLPGLRVGFWETTRGGGGELPTGEPEVVCFPKLPKSKKMVVDVFMMKIWCKPQQSLHQNCL